MVVGEYGVGDYFPREKLSDCAVFSVVAESSCEVVSIGRGSLRILGWREEGEVFRG